MRPRFRQVIICLWAPRFPSEAVRAGRTLVLTGTLLANLKSFSGKINACGSSLPGSPEDVNVITRGSIGLPEGTGASALQKYRQTEDQSRNTGEWSNVHTTAVGMLEQARPGVTASLSQLLQNLVSQFIPLNT